MLTLILDSKFFKVGQVSSFKFKFQLQISSDTWNLMFNEMPETSYLKLIRWFTWGDKVHLG